jgi:hypothetical protein
MPSARLAHDNRMTVAQEAHVKGVHMDQCTDGARGRGNGTVSAMSPSENHGVSVCTEMVQAVCHPKEGQT